MKFGLKRYEVGFTGTDVKCEVLAKNREQAIGKAMFKMAVKVHNCETYCILSENQEF